MKSHKIVEYAIDNLSKLCVTSESINKSDIQEIISHMERVSEKAVKTVIAQFETKHLFSKSTMDNSYYNVIGGVKVGDVIKLTNFDQKLIVIAILTNYYTHYTIASNKPLKYSKNKEFFNSQESVNEIPTIEIVDSKIDFPIFATIE